MKKILIWILLLSMLLTMVSCDMLDVSSIDCECPNCKGSSGTTTVTTKPDEIRYGEGDSIIYTKQEYDEIIKGTMPDDFIYYEQISAWGEFKEILAHNTRLDNYEWLSHYEYVLNNNVSLIIKPANDINDINKLYNTYCLNYGVAIIMDHPSNDLRRCQYKDGEPLKSMYMENEIIYLYFKARLNSIFWIHDGLLYQLTGSYGRDFVWFVSGWRTWISLFFNKQSNDRAIEFFGMMLDGELPTIEEVFGDTTEPCEITWQKPTAPAQTV